MKRATTHGEKSRSSRKKASPREPNTRSRPTQNRGAHHPVLFERHPLPGWIFDPKSLTILAVNDAAIDHYGYTRKEFLSMTLRDIHPPQEVPALLEYLRHPPSTSLPGQSRTEPWVHRKKDGTRVEVEVRWSRIPFRRKAAVLFMVNDVTECGKHQAEIQRHLDRLRILQEISAAVTTTLDLNTVIEYFLRKANRLLPYSAFTIKLWNGERKVLEPVICRNLNEQEWKTELRKGTRDLTTVPFETNQPFAVTRIEADPRAGRPEFARKHGLVSYLGVPLSVKGEAIGVLSTYTKEEHRFRREEIEFFSTLASQVGFAIHNAKIYEQAQQTLKRIHALCEVNAAINPLLEVSAVLDTLLKKIIELLPYASVTIRLLNKETGNLDAAACWNIDEDEWRSEEANPAYGFARAVFETRAPTIIRNVQTDPIVRNHDLFRKHGLVSCVGVPLISQEQILGTITFYTKEEREFSAEEVEFLSTLAGLAGIALQKSRLYEEATKAAQELEKANRVKDEFLSVVSHELRTPLNVVMGYAGIIKDKLFGEINSQQEEALGKILARTHDQLTLVNNILYASAMESTDLKGKNFAVSMGDFFAQLKEAYQFPVGKKAVTVNWNPPPRGLVINTDPDKLRHILQNLIDNAIKFTEKGSVTVSSRVRHKSGELEIRIADTGIGLTKEQMSLIFGKFHQLDGSLRRLYGGVGLGLYIVKRFTEMLGGTVEVQSEVGRGSTFKVTIPCESQPAESQGNRK